MEINARYDSKWIFLTNCEFTPGSKLIRGIPRVIADKQAEGVDEGVYDTIQCIKGHNEGRSDREVSHHRTAYVGYLINDNAYKHGKTRRYDAASISVFSDIFKLIWSVAGMRLDCAIS